MMQEKGGDISVGKAAKFVSGKTVQIKCWRKKLKCSSDWARFT